MQNNQTEYCILERFCSLENQTNSTSKMDRNLFHDRDVFLEEHSNFLSVKQRILEIANIWKIYIAYEVKQKNISNDVLEANTTVVLRNRWEGWLQVGVSDRGWLLIMQNVGESIRGSFSDNKSAKIVAFTLPEWTEFFSNNLISEEKAEYVITKWLDKNEVVEDIMTF